MKVYILTSGDTIHGVSFDLELLKNLGMTSANSGYSKLHWSDRHAELWSMMGVWRDELQPTYNIFTIEECEVLEL